MKRIDGDHEEKASDDSSRHANRSSLYISFDNNKAAFESARGSIFETQREGDRFSFACDQSAILKAVKQIEGNKTIPSTGLDTETSSNTLKTPQARRISDDLLENTQLRRKSSLNNGDEAFQTLSRRHVEREELAVVYSRRSSCPSSCDVTSIKADNTEREQISPLLNKNSGTKSVGKFPVFNENKIPDQDQILKEYYSLPLSSRRTHQKEASEDENDEEDSEIKTSESMIRNHQKNDDQNLREEEEDKSPNMLSTSEKKLKCNPFARRKQKRNDPNRQSKSHNNSLNFVEDGFGFVLNNTVRSPNFKDNRDK